MTATMIDGDVLGGLLVGLTVAAVGVLVIVFHMQLGSQNWRGNQRLLRYRWSRWSWKFVGTTERATQVGFRRVGIGFVVVGLLIVALSLWGALR